MAPSEPVPSVRESELRKLQHHREAIRAGALIPEADLAPRLIACADMHTAARERAQTHAADFVKRARAEASRSSLIDKFLLEYGLSTSEGVTLMRLAEALLRTPDAATADALIKDKVEAGDWRAHVGKSPFPLVNISTRALMLTAAWLDDMEAKDPLRRIVGATKDLLDRLGDPTIRGAVGQAMRIMGEHFVLGQTIEEAIDRSRAFAARGYAFSYDMLGEAALTAADADRFHRDYSHAIAALSAAAQSDDVRANPGISVKLSALHPRYEHPKAERVRADLGPRLKELALAAKRGRLGFNIDAEEADRLDLSLDLIEVLARDPDLAGWDGFGVVVQAYQRRALDVVEWLAALARETNRKIMVRLVKGAYWDAEIKRAQVMGLESYPVYTRKTLTDVSYIACARLLLRHADVLYPQFATHNALSATLVAEMADSGASYEFQRLHGMGEALHDRLIEGGARSRIYAPVGGHKELLPYLVRRLLENGANSSFVNQLFDPDLAIDTIVADPIAELERLEAIANPDITSPRDQFAGERLAALGLDETDHATAERLARAAEWRAPAVPPSPVVAFDIHTETLPGRDIQNPADLDRHLATVREADGPLVNRALAAAIAAAPRWAARPSSDRAAILRKAAALLEARYDDFIRLAVNEAGKTLPDAIAEVREAVDFLRYYADRAEDLPGAPLGVVACISPWNFPLAIFLGQISAALVAGNTVIAKPAEQTPLIAIEGAKLLLEAGVPAGALQLLPGDGPNVGAPLVADKRIAGVVFTGSTAVAQSINRTLAERASQRPALIAETGGINAMIIDSTALMEQAVADVIASAFQSAGQRCSACRLVAVQADVADRFFDMLAGAMAELSVDDPARLSTDVGPLIDAEAHADITAYVAKMKASARVIFEAPAPKDGRGHFIAPIAFEIDAIDDMTREVFGPVLHVAQYQADALENVLTKINALGYGLTMGLHSRIDDTMEAVAARARVGNLYVNRNQIGAVVGVQPFGGERLSGTGPKAGGPHYLEALRRPVSSDAAASTNEPETQAVDADGETAMLSQRMRMIEDAFDRWRIAPDRADRLHKAAIAAKAANNAAAARVLSAAAKIARETASPIELPGPTGEANTLSLRPRGLVLCLGGAPGVIENQLAKALGVGDAVAADERVTTSIAEALASAAGVKDIALALPLQSGAPRDILTAPTLAAVAFDGPENEARALLRILAARDGPLIPLLSGDDPNWKYGVERTLTINVTAAGGDVRLLSLPG
ncbi:MAG: bifunctional proline dehydrogenase/L-glutamate gamma-semialdehyde dehydrogenase PutA [Pseudomonadota bacterium]